MTVSPVWLWISGIYFIVQTVFTLGLLFALYKLVTIFRQLVPKIAAIGDKVHDIGSKVEDLTVSVKTTVDNVGGRAKSVAGSADLIAHTASRSFEKFSPYVIGIMSALRIIKAVREFRQGSSLADATKQKALDPKRETLKDAAKLDKKRRK
jgi:hypothetical protein